MAPEVFCKLDVNSFTWPENQKKGGKQGKENHPLPFSTVRESILPKGWELTCVLTVFEEDGTDKLRRMGQI